MFKQMVPGMLDNPMIQFAPDDAGRAPGGCTGGKAVV